MSKEDITLEHSGKAFTAQLTRAKTLDDKAEKLAAAVVVVIGFHLIDSSMLKLQGSAAIQAVISIAALALLGASLVAAYLGRRIQKYVGYPKAAEFLDMLSPNDVDEERAKLLVAKVYLNAAESNREINNKKAQWLTLSSWLLLVGLLAAVISATISKML